MLGGGYRKLIPTGSTARMLADGFRDGRHELSPLCPGACGARPRLVGDSIRLRRGHLRGHRQKARPARACRFRDGPARDPGKSPRAGCLGHHHQTFKSDTRCPPRIPHPSHRSRAQARGGFRADTPFLPIPWGGGSPQGGETEGRRGTRRCVSDTLHRLPALRAGPPKNTWRPAANAAAHFPMEWGRKAPSHFPRIYSGAWWRFRRRLDWAPAQGRGKCSGPGEVERTGKRSAAAKTQLSRVARTSARRMSIGARPCLVRTCQ